MRIALISGASSGLGRGLALSIGENNHKRKGFDFDEIWVIARRLDRLESLQGECQSKIRPIALDLGKEDSFLELEGILREANPEIGLLFCSAGFGKIGDYSQVDRQQSGKMIDLNCKAAVELTQICLPYMKEDSHIGEVCSTVGFLPLPYLNVYAATKAFMLSYSRALKVELKQRKITVTAICPYWVKDTEFIGSANTGSGHQEITFYKFASKSEDVVKKALNDTVRGKSVSTPGFVSKSVRLLRKLLPTSWILWGWERIRK